MIPVFIRINKKHVINLSNVTEIVLTSSAGTSGSRTAIIINFTGDTPLTIYEDDPGFVMLKTWMSLQQTIPDYDAPAEE